MRAKPARLLALMSATVCFFLPAASTMAIPVAHLTLRSQPGDFIGQGGDFDLTYTPQNSDFFSAAILRTIGPDPAYLTFTLGNIVTGANNTFADLDFSTTQLGIPIRPGFYPDAQRAAFASPGHPGLAISFQNRGCNTLTGSFTVEKASFVGSSILAFDASFVQHCEGGAPALFGTFSYAAPEPHTLALIVWSLLPLIGVVKRMARRESGRWVDSKM